MDNASAFDWFTLEAKDRVFLEQLGRIRLAIENRDNDVLNQLELIHRELVEMNTLLRRTATVPSPS